MKIIGLMLTWDNLEFFRYALEQALDFCDELILVEGCHSQHYPKHSTDGTCVYIETVKAHPKLRIADFDYRGRYDHTQRYIRAEYPKMSHYYEPGNWIFHWDDDLFFFEKDLPKIKNAMRNGGADSLDFRARYFFYNFRFNLLQRSGCYCYKIVEDSRLQGVSVHLYSNGKRFSILPLDSVTAFHYCYVKKPGRMKARWVMSVEKGARVSIGRFEKWMEIEWEKDEDFLKCGNEMHEMREQSEGLNIYKGTHPEVLDGHPWRHINDVRMR